MTARYQLFVLDHLLCLAEFFGRGSFVLLVGRLTCPKSYIVFVSAQADEEGRDNVDAKGSSRLKGEEYTKDGTVDFRGRPAIKARTGGWKTSWFIYCEFRQNEGLGFAIWT